MRNFYNLLKGAAAIVVLLLFMLVGMPTQVNAQVTTLLSPTGAGGFELGTTFLANGWNNVDAAGNRDWYVGNAAGVQGGSRAAFVGTNSTTFADNQASATLSYTHIWRDIAIPAASSNITLTFYIKQPRIDNTYDYFNVYTGTTATTMPNNNYPTGGSVVSRYSNTATTYAGYTLQTVALPNTLSGTTVRLIFTWKNDAASPWAAGAVDNIGLTYTPYWNPCTGGNIQTLSACATNATATFATGNNNWNPPTGGPYGTPGQERIFSFTPTQSGNYRVSQSSASSTYVDYFYRTAASGCGIGGWTYIDDIYGNNSSNGNINISLTAGTQYYFLLDPETDANFSVSWQLVCPPVPPQWQSQWISMSVPSTWCAGQTQNVSVTVRNIGAATWSNSAPDINIGCKWNGDADYFVRVDAGGLASGSQQTYTLAMTAPAAGANNITFDVVNEGNCWFGNNNGSCGPGNVTYQSSAVTINSSSVSCATSSLAPANGATGVCAQGNGAVSSISWAAASGATLYDVYFGTSSNPPLVSPNQAGTSWGTGALALNQLYYWRVVPKNGCSTATGCATYSFTTAAAPCGCINGLMYPTSAFNAPGPGSTYSITTAQYQSEYNQVNNVTSGHTFISTASIAGTYVTVRYSTPGGTQVAFGPAPLSWTATSGTGTYYIHYNTNSSCGTASTGMTTTLQNTTPPAYRSAWVSMSVPSAWCTGVAQNVSVTVTNNGSAAWTNSGPDINIGCKWNEEADYLIGNRLNCNGLAPGATQTFTFSMTPTVTGSNNIRFDVVNEGNCWFRDNSGQCGPGNIEYVSSAVTVTNGSVVLNNTGTPAASSQATGTNNVVLHGFKLATSSCVASYNFTAVTIANSGSATSTDITNLRLYRDVNNSGTWDGGDVLASASTPANGASITFTTSGQTGLTADRNYILVGDIAAGAVTGRTFTATSTTPTVTPSVTGAAAGNTMTIAPSNDLCSAATLLTVGGAAVQGNWDGSSATSGSPYRDVWYTFTPCSTATHTITLNGLAIAGDRDLYVYTSCPGTYVGSPVYSATGSDPNSESITNTFNAGTTYYILAQDWSGGGSTFNIAVTGPTANLALANTGTPATGYIPAGTTNAVLHGFSLTPACGLTTYDFTSLTVANTGSALTSDISNIRVYYDVNNSGTWDGGDTQVSSPQGLSALMGFTITGQTAVSGTRRYLVVGNVASNATGGNTFIAGTTTPTASVAVNGTATGNTLTISPINNDCAGAIAFGALSAGCTNVTVNTAGATQTLGGCSGNADDDVWFSFTMPAGYTSISFTNTNISGNTDRVLQFYSGTCGSLTSLLCSDPETGTLTGLTPLATYYVRAYTVTAGVSSQFSLCIALPPANNDCAGAISFPTLAPGCTNVDVNTIGATQSLVANCTGTADDDVWYSFVEPVGYTTLTYSMTDISGNNDRVIEFYNSSCGVGSIYCSTNETGSLTGLVGGNTYWVRVYTAANAVTSNFTLCLALPPANDDCAGAIAFPTLQPGCNTVTANTGAATASPVTAPCTGTADDDVWYSFVIASTTNVGYSMTNVSGNTDRVIQFYSTSCGGTSIYCNTAESGLLGSLTAGTYWVRVFTAGASVSSEFDLCIALPPANDVPCSAIALASPDLCNPIVGTTQLATASQGTNGVPAGCAGNADDDVWYSFVATSTAHTVTVVGSSGFNAVVQVYTLSGTCPGGATYTAVANTCSNATGVGGTESLIIRGLTIGVTYYVRVHDSATGASTSPTFTICVTENPLGIPVTYYDFELNSARNTTGETTVEQSVNTATTFIRTGGAFSSQAGAAIAVYGGTINGRALTGTPPDASASPTTNPSDYIEVALNTSGLQTLSLDFDVYCNYEDYFFFQLWPDVGINYSTDGGATWNILASFATDWGIWQFPADPLILPASCNNNPNVKIRFYGFNTLGAADFAIDNFTLFGASTSVGAGVKNLIDFNAHYTGTKSSGSGLMYTFDKFTANGAGSTVNLINSDISLSNELKVTNSGTLNFGTGTIPRYSLNTGASAFNLDPTGTIGVTDAAGITTTGNTGNVRSTGVRTFSTAGNYTYIDNAAQVTGNGMPTTVNNLTINNSTGVTITNAGATVNGVLDLTSGILKTTTLATDNIIIGATGSVSRTAGWVYANLRKPVIAGNPVRNFEVGNLTNYTPATLAFTGVSTPGNYTVRAVIGQQPNIGTSCLSTTQYVNQYWKLVNGGVSATNYAATFAYTGAELIGSPAVANLVVGRYNAGWTYPTVSGTPSGTDLTAAGITSDGDFQIAQGIVPSVTLAASPSGAVCEGANVTFTATPTNGGTTPNYEFKVNGTQVQTGTGNTYASSTLVTGDVVTVVLTSNANCIISNNIANPVSPITMTVNPAPDLTIVDPAGKCSPATVDITALGVATDNNGVTGTLSYHTTLANANANIPMANPNLIAVGGTYYIKKTATVGGCSDVEPVVVNIFTAPDLVLSDPATVCAPATVDITLPAVAVDVNGTVGSFSYYSSGVDADAGINQIANPTAISVSGFYYIRKTTNVGGCYDYDALYVDISLLPNLSVTNPPAECTPTTIDITDLVWVDDLNGTVGTYSYHTTLANANANIPMANPTAVATSGIYYIKKTTTSGSCSDIEQIIVTINPAPNLVVTNPAAVCYPATIDLATTFVDANGTTGIVNYYPTLADANASTNALATPNAMAVSGTYYIKKSVTLGGCTDIEPVTIVVNPCGGLTWDGSVSTDWNDANNWTPPYVPTAADNITIPNVANDPVLSAGAMGVCKDVTITGGAPIAIASGYTLDVKGNWTGTTATIVSGAGKTIFSAAVAQTITGGGTFSTLQVTNTNGLTIASGANKVKVTTALELKAGQLITNGNLITVSTALSTAYIDDFSPTFTPGTISGNVAVERYITNGPNGYRYIGAPVATTAGGSTLNLSALSGFVISGTPGQLIPLPTCNPNNSAQNSPYGTFMRWEEAGPFLYNCRQSGWWFQTTGTMTIGRGYGAKVGSGTKITYTGAANTGSISYGPLANSGPIGNGWHLVSNPFPSSMAISNIDGNANNNMPAGFNGQIQLYITSGPYTGSYLAYNTGIETAPFALGQGFWVQSTGSGTFTVNNNFRVTNQVNYYDVNSDIQHHLNVNVAGNGFMDKTDIYFLPTAQTGFDFYDAEKWESRSDQPTLYTKVGSQSTAINSLPSLEETIVVPMGVKPGTNGNYTFTFDDIATFPQTSMIYLEDLQLGTMNNLRENNTYSFTANVNDNADRFMLHFQPGLQAEVADQDCDNAGSIELTQPAPTIWSTYEVRGNDNNVYAQGTDFTGSTTITNLPPQEYVVTVTHASGYSAQEYITVNGNSPVNATINASATNVMVDEMVSLTGTATDATEYDWNFGDGNTQSGSSTVVHAYDAEGVYTVSMTASNSTCNDVASKVINVTKTTTGINGTEATNVKIYGQGERVVIEFNNWGGNKADIFMYNALGQRVESLTGVSTLKGRQDLYIADIIPGTYFIQVVSDGKIQGKKVFLGKH